MRNVAVGQGRPIDRWPTGSVEGDDLRLRIKGAPLRKTTILDHVGKQLSRKSWALRRAEIVADRGSAYSDDVKNFFLTVRG